MLSKKQIETLVRPAGFYLQVLNQETRHNCLVLQLLISGVDIEGEDIQCEFTLVLPIADDKYDRILTVQGAHGPRRIIVLDVVYPDMLGDVFSDELIVKTWRRSVTEALADAISGAIMNWRFRGAPPSSMTINSLFNTWLNTSPQVRPVDDLSEMKLTSIMESVIFEQHDELMSHNSRVFNKAWLPFIDPSSTTTSDKVNLVYRLTAGTKVKDHKLVAGGHNYCSTLNDNCIVTGLGPRRIYLLRTTFENSEILSKPEDPIVLSKKNGLSGVNLLTVIADLGEYTFEDCIAVSETAAAKLECRIVKTETFRSLHSIEVKVKELEVVGPGQIIAKDCETALHASKIYTDACVAEIREGRTYFNGFEMNTVETSLVSLYGLTDGDKISNRHAVKAVIRILPDCFMPQINGKAADLCVSPASIYGRRSMSMYYEMMASRAIQDGMKIDASNELPDLSFKDLAVTHGQSLPCIYKGKQVNLFYGYVYWIRINKHSVEMRSEKNDIDKNYNQYGVLVDSTFSNGQRFDIAKTLAFQAKGLERSWKEIVRDNAIGTKRLKQLLAPIMENTIDE